MVEKISTEKLLENTQTFICKKCNYTTCKKSSWTKHLSTDKHLFNKVEKFDARAMTDPYNHERREKRMLEKKRERWVKNYTYFFHITMGECFFNW